MKHRSFPGAASHGWVRWMTAVVIALVAALSTAGATERYRLDNGMEIILKENHSSPMITSIVFVKSGSKYESKYENGITHFLEHLLFDGTATLSREELDASIQNLGGMVNAFTRKELTSFFVLMPKQYIEYGMTAEADMLFNSIIPEEELPKERKVVIEEINRDADAPGAAAQAFFTEKAYAGTRYDRPVLGYSAFIENIPREAVIDYWKRYYIPKNMIVLIIGDFVPEEMKKTVASVFGKYQNPPDSLTEGRSSEATATVPPLTGQKIYDTVANVSSTYINFSFAAPHHSDSLYLAMDLLSRYLGMSDISPLSKALTGGANPLATDVGVDLVTYSEFSRLDISVITDNPANRDAIIATVLEQLKAMEDHVADPETIEGIITSTRCDEIYNSEKLYYYGFLISSRLMSVGWDFIETYGDRLAKLTWDKCRQAAREWLSHPNYIATVVTPVGESGKTPYVPHGLTKEEVIAHFDSTTFPTYDLITGHKITYPQTDSVDFELVDHAEYHLETLCNGMNIIIKSDPGSKVFAMNILGKNRTASEPPGKAGITDFVNRCIEKGTLTRNAHELSRDLAKIGAQVTLYDNPWIPFDDRYTSRRFSFMKFETIDEFAEKGFALFSEMFLYPAFDSTEVENVRRAMLGALARKSMSPRDVARNLFYEKLFEGTPYANPIMGTPETIRSITIDDLKDHHAHFYSPENVILTIVTSHKTDEVLEWVDRTFGRLAETGYLSKSMPKPQPIQERRTAHQELNKEQITFYLGSLLPGASSEEAVPLAVASSILSTRLYLNLREKQGLCYSVGAGTTFDKDFGWFYASIGTASPNYQKALDGILLQMDKLNLDGPTEEEVKSARNRIWGSLMRAKLARINQAYYLGLDKYLGFGPDRDKQLLSQLAKVTPASVRRAAAKYFRTDTYVLTSAGKKP